MSDQPTRITILVDNNVQPNRGLMPEHGFSALVERPGLRFLFDTGQGKALPHNAQALGVDLSGLDAVILSHGHYDHTGGLNYVIGRNPGIRIIAHPKALSKHFSVRRGEKNPRYVGIPYQESALKEAGGQLDLTETFTEVLDNVWFTGFVPRDAEFVSDKGLVRRRDGKWHSDIIEDDASLVVGTPKGPVVLFGCAHAGVGNTLAHIQQNMGIETIYAVIGGTHLGFQPESALHAAIEDFERFKVQLVGTAHCTGEGPNRALKKHFNDRFHHAWAGTVFEFGESE